MVGRPGSAIVRLMPDSTCVRARMTPCTDSHIGFSGNQECLMTCDLTTQPRNSGYSRRVAGFGSGHHQRVSLSPVTAIADMVAPVVLITLATIFVNGLMTVGSAFATDVLALEPERTGILRGPR